MPEQQWTAADTEQVRCCVCHEWGEVRYRLDPFAVVQCPTCGLVFVSPRLNPKALQRFYDQPSYFEDGGVYGGQAGGRNPAMLLQRAWTNGRLAAIGRVAPAPGRLLEIGSAYGLFLAAAQRAGYQVNGVELSAAGAQESQRRGFEVFNGQLVDAPATDRNDVVCFWDTLEHVPDPLEFLVEVRRRLVDHGTFALSVPYISSLPAKVLGKRWWTLKPEQHIWHFTPATLQTTAARAGLVVTDVITSPLNPANLTRLDSLVAIGRALPS
ncbi:class I SAM-dependent methyltransferase [Nakamurella lactea]|uniref:class I SAM-dependent methyltransferase n=1 Tax=Nakamurella lactea TaxID=459515 RepID=UPI000412ED03|nr:class I SAM-dependent methyltransferase [Nakamurella lactea]